MSPAARSATRKRRRIPSLKSAIGPAPLSHTVSCVVANSVYPNRHRCLSPRPVSPPTARRSPMAHPTSRQSQIRNRGMRVCMKRLWTPAKKRIYIVLLLVPNRLACSNTPRRFCRQHGRLARQCSRLPFASGKRVASYGGCPYSSKRIWTARQVSSITLPASIEPCRFAQRTHRKPGPPRSGSRTVARFIYNDRPVADAFDNQGLC